MTQSHPAPTESANSWRREIDRGVQLVRAYQAGLDRTLALMASTLPGVFHALESIQDDGADRQGSITGSVRDRLYETRTIADTVRCEIEPLLRANQVALETAENVASASDEIASLVQSVGRVGWELSLTGLNASVLAARTHDEGLAFATLTHALTNLADGSARDARALQASAKELAQVGKAQARSQAESADAHRDALDGAREHLAEAAEGVAESVTSVSDTVDDARQRTRSAMGTIRRIMGAVQREDILRQKLDHLLLVFFEIRDQFDASLESLPPDRIRFVQQSARLVDQLWVEVRNDAKSLVDDIAASLQHLQPATALAELPRSAVDAIRARAISPLCDMRDRLAALEQGPRSDLEEDANALEQSVDGMRRRLQELQDNTRQLAVLYVLIRIEVARIPTRAEAGTIPARIAEANQSLRNLLAASFAAITSLGTELCHMRKTAAQLEHRDATLARLRVTTHDHIRQLEAAGSALADHLQKIREHGAALMNDVERFQGEIDAFAQVTADANAVLEITSELQKSATRLIDALPQDSSDSEASPISPRMVELVNRFTVLSHKNIAAGIIEIEVESGDAGGEVTLF